MLKSGTRSAGVAVREKKSSPHSREKLGTVCGGVGVAAQQVDRALVVAEVVHRSGDLATLDAVDAVAGEAGEQQGLRVDLADVPHAGQQQAVLHPGDEVGLGAGGPRRRPAPGCRSRGWSAGPSGPRCAGSGSAR